MPIALVPTTASAYYPPPPLMRPRSSPSCPPYSLDPLPFLLLLDCFFIAHVFYFALSSPVSVLPVDFGWPWCDSEVLFSLHVDAVW
jgi:hypothetical protein